MSRQVRRPLLAIIVDSVFRLIFYSFFLSLFTSLFIFVRLMLLYFLHILSTKQSYLSLTRSLPLLSFLFLFLLLLLLLLYDTDGRILAVYHSHYKTLASSRLVVRATHARVAVCCSTRHFGINLLTFFLFLVSFPFYRFNV